jgi:hypothetical protein
MLCVARLIGEDLESKNRLDSIWFSVGFVFFS